MTAPFPPLHNAPEASTQLGLVTQALALEMLRVGEFLNDPGSTWSRAELGRVAIKRLLALVLLPLDPETGNVRDEALEAETPLCEELEPAITALLVGAAAFVEGEGVSVDLTGERPAEWPAEWPADAEEPVPALPEARPGLLVHVVAARHRARTNADDFARPDDIDIYTSAAEADAELRAARGDAAQQAVDSHDFRRFDAVVSSDDAAREEIASAWPRWRTVPTAGEPTHGTSRPRIDCRAA